MSASGRRRHLNRLATSAVAALVSGLVACTKAEPGSPPDPIADLTYQPFAAAFVGSTHRIVEQEFDGQVVTTKRGIRLFVRAELAPVGTRRIVSFTMDSVVPVDETAGSLMSDQFASARGATFTATVAPNGELDDWSSGESVGESARQLADQFLRRFFPRLPDAGVREGMSWGDSVQTTELLGGAETLITSLRTHNAVGWTEIQGERALQISTESHYTFSGSGMQVGQVFAVDGRGRRHSSHYVSAVGHYLGSISADTSEAQAEVASVGIVIPVRQTRTDSLLKTP